MSTADVAADMDLLRAALGEDQLNYLGYSYGTSIGAVYATLFPENVRAMVLDGSVSPQASDEDQLLAQALGFERTLANFVAACNASSDCALAPDAQAAIDATRQQLEASPVEVETESGTRTLGPDLFDLAVATALYDTTLWGALALSVDQVDSGGAATLLSLVDRQTGRQPDGSYDNSSDAQTMVSCSDSAERPSVDEATATAQRILEQAPTFGGVTAYGALGCLGWPTAANPLPELTGAGAPTVLVVGTVGDPATPYEWSEQMAQALESAVLLTYEGDGHTAFLRGGPCIDDAVVAYLVDLTVPAEGTRCPAQGTEATFTSIRDEVLAQLEQSIPSDVATCVIDGIIADIGEAEFTQLVLSGDQERLTRLVTAQAMQCAAGGLSGD
jgi:pimeloyl-ACP methyl ester carboxylesterase